MARKLGVAIFKERVLYSRRNGGDASQFNSELVNLWRGMNDVERFLFFCHNMAKNAGICNYNNCLTF
jgi:hypothetical protein